MTWGHHIISCLLLLSCLAGARLQAELRPDELTHEHVVQMRDAIIEGLYRHQDPDRHWDPVTMPGGESTNQHLGGYTALVCLALITAGESYQDERLQGPLRDLEAAPLKGTYAVATRALIWAALPDRFNANLARDAQWLLNSYNVEAAGWDYKARPTGTITAPSPSIRHFGTLALWEAAKRGHRVPPGILQSIEQVTLQTQDMNGAWHYKNESGPSGSMTAAGLVTLAITDELLHAREAIDLKRDMNTHRHRAAEAGLAWLDEQFTSHRTPGDTSRGSKFPLYWLYAVERVGLAQGMTRLGRFDWFREGAATIRKRLFDETADGVRLKAAYGPGGKSAALRELGFALLFLSRGSAPVAVNKLEVDGGRWNNRPRDVANLCRSLSDEHETLLHWQTVTVDDAGVHDAPVLYIASDDALPMLAPHRPEIREFGRRAADYLKRRRTGTLQPGERAPRPPSIPAIDPLRRFLESGGTIVAVNEGRGKAFAESMRDLGTVLNPGIEWTKPGPDHWIYNEPFKVRGTRPRIELYGTGVREWIVLVPAGDLSSTLQSTSKKTPANMMTLMNLHARASGMLDTPHRLDLTSSTPGSGRHEAPACRIRQVVHDGQWRAEPMAIRHLADALNAGGVPTDARATRLDARTDFNGIDCLLISGTNDTSLSSTIWTAIERYLRETDGLVLFEHAGGGDGGIFAARAEQDAMARFSQPVRSLERAPIVTGDGIPGATDCSSATWQPYSITEIFGEATDDSRLRGMMIDGEPRLLFSREDLTHALLDRPRWGVHGYSNAAAHALLANVMRTAMHRRRSP
jgi:hypothetical protein